jgi:hydroxyacylglutathione hydrolase
MILQRVEHPEWLSNAYLVVDEIGGHGVLVDSNGITDPLCERAEREGSEITHLLLTHHHADHVADARKLAQRFGVPILAHEKTAEILDGVVDETFGDGDVIESGGLRIEVMHTPGHCADHCALSVNGTDVMTADVIFKGTVGGTRAPGATGFEDLRSSVMDRLMKLGPETRFHPGHREPTTVGVEWEWNPFIRIWRGLDPENAEPCTVGPADPSDRKAATLVLWAPDYDGGNKAWVRFADDSEAVVGGSQVQRGSASSASDAE